MFRRLASSLPKDFEFPPGFEGLGYYINDEDQIRMTEDPNQPFNYFASKNQRFVERQREAMNEAIRENVVDRLLGLSLEITRLPLGAAENENHVPILTSKNLVTADRVIVFIGQAAQDLGILAGRVIGRDSISSGSAIDFARAALSADDKPALIIANPGQLVWLRRRQKAMSQQSFQAEVRPTAVSLPYRQDPIENTVPQNRTVKEHIEYVLSHVIDRLAKPAAKIQILAMAPESEKAMEILDANWAKYSKRMSTFVRIESYCFPMSYQNADFAEWFSKKARAYMMASDELDTPVPGRIGSGCNCYSAGEHTHLECVPVYAYPIMLAFLEHMHRHPGYEHTPQDLDREEEECNRFGREDEWDVVDDGPGHEEGEWQGEGGEGEGEGGEGEGGGEKGEPAEEERAEEKQPEVKQPDGL